jgi:hypothetical protein
LSRTGLRGDLDPRVLQIMARRFDEVTLLAAAAAWERLAPWADALPPLVAQLGQAGPSSGKDPRESRANQRRLAE